MNGNIYKWERKEELKIIQDFTDDADFAVHEWENRLKVKEDEIANTHPEETGDLDEEAAAIGDIIDAYYTVKDALTYYKGIV